MIQKFEVLGMTCSGCSSTVNKVVGKLHGVKSVQVVLEEKYMNVDFDETVLTNDDVIKAVYNAGFDAKVI